MFLELSCSFDDPAADVGNLSSGFSAFSKSSLNIWNFSIHMLLEPHWHYFSLGLEWKLTFSSPVATAEFSNLAGVLSAAFSQHHLLGWNSSNGIPSPPLAMFAVMLPKAHWTSHSRMSDSWWVITPLWLSGSWRSFLYISSVHSSFLLISSTSISFCPLLCSSLHEMFPWYLQFS